MKKILFHLIAMSLIAWFLSGCTGHPSGYSIQVSVKGSAVSDSLILSRYEGSKPVVLAALPVSSGRVVLSGGKALPPGMFTLTFRKNEHIDFLISDTLHQSFEISADAGNFLSSVSFVHSPENSAFTEYRRFMEGMMKKRGELTVRMQENNWSPDSVSKINEAFNRIRDENTSRIEKIKQQFPGSMLALFLRIMKETPVPEPVIPLMVTDRNRYLEEYYSKYLSNHFFDETDFADPRIISVPLYEEKLRYYFMQLVEPVRETAEPKIEMVLDKAGANEEVYRFTVRFLYRMFREASVPSFMQESVFIAEKFILGDPGQWRDTFFVDNVREKVAKFKLNPVGTVATDLKLTRPSGELIRLSEVKARRIILYFFNPACEACVPITEKLNLIWQKYKNQGVQVFAVYLERNPDVWKEFIVAKKLDWIHVFDPSGDAQIEKKYDIYAIPMIYLLDQNKKIIAKDVPVEKLEEYIKS